MLVVLAVIDLLWAHVVRRAYVSVGELRLLVHSSCQTEVPYLHVAVGVQEDVARLEVSVKDLGALALAFAPMAVVEPLRDLSHNLPDNVLRNVLLLLSAAPYYLSEVPLLAVLHDDVDLLILLVNDAIVVANNVRVAKLSEDVHFGHDLLLLFLAHGTEIELLPHHNLAVTLPTDLAHFTERA